MAPCVPKEVQTHLYCSDLKSGSLSVTFVIVSGRLVAKRSRTLLYFPSLEYRVGVRTSCDKPKSSNKPASLVPAMFGRADESHDGCLQLKSRSNKVDTEFSCSAVDNSVDKMLKKTDGE